ncbi:MAG TPA: hypothetical protein VMO17_13480 [Terriglobia bacterium]|nr:hypothetical protein [Terriglobia bacterium]
MHKNLVVMVAAMCLGACLAGAARAQDVDWGAQRRQLKQQQKLELDSLKAQQHNMKQSWSSGHISSAERSRAEHQMQRELRDLKQRQKDAMQDLKDHEKAMKEMHHAYGG